MGLIGEPNHYCHRYLTNQLNSSRNVYAWLVPEYTISARDACTRIEGTDITLDSTRQNISNRTGRQSCYIIPTKAQGVMEKITEVALLRSATKVKSPSTQWGQYDGMSRDLNVGRHASYVHILWRTISIS